MNRLTWTNKSSLINPIKHKRFWSCSALFTEPFLLPFTAICEASSRFTRRLTIQAALMKSLVATIAELEVRVIPSVPAYLRKPSNFDSLSYFTNRFLLLLWLLYRVKPESAVLFHQSNSFRFMKRRLRESNQFSCFFYFRDDIGATSQHPEPVHQHNVPHTPLLASTP